MNTSQDRALSFLVSQHLSTTLEDLPDGAESQAERTISMSTLPKESKKARQLREETREIQSLQALRNVTPPPPVEILPEAGTLSARDFMVGMRRTNDRTQQIRLIAGFMGYRQDLSFGAQDHTARMNANRQLSNKVLAPTRSETVESALQGGTIYVTGMPDHTAKALANLQAQQVTVVEAMVNYERDMWAEHKTPVERELAFGLSKIEYERLQSIRAEISRLTNAH
jgi:hypothetical protein